MDLYVSFLSLLVVHVFSFADLQKPQIDLDGKACAGVGQNCLMALYDTMFSQVGEMGWHAYVLTFEKL